MAEDWNNTLSNPSLPTSTIDTDDPNSPDNPSVVSTSEGITETQKDEYLEVGRISKMRSEIDQGGIISDQLKKRMSVIDIIPCLFRVNYGSMLGGELTLTDKFKPTVEYKKSIDDFASTQWSYGLKPYAFLRMYLTDMTSSSDDMTNEYGKNIIDAGLDSLTSGKLGQFAKTIFNAAQSSGTSTPHIGDVIKKGGTSFDYDVTSNVKNNINIAQDILTHGSRISFPKIWNSSSYSPNLSCVVKLVSPYGHPKAVNEFIIKPLAYLLILLSPTTTQGITTNRPNYLTLKSYGLSNMTLCYPRQLTIRRGGDDSSYNSFLQPMTVEVSMTFEAVTEGFACFSLPSNSSSDTELHSDGQIFSGTEPLSVKDFSKDFDMPSALFPTLKSMINSFRPFGYTPSAISTGAAGSTGTASSLMNDIRPTSSAISPSNEEFGLSIESPTTSEITNIDLISAPEGVSVTYM